MARKVLHNHSNIKKLHIKQFTTDRSNPDKEGTIKKNESLKLDDSVNGSYYLEFQIPGNRYCTIDFDKTYGVEKFTRKKDENNPQMDRILFKVENLAGPYSGSPEPADDNVDVKDPDEEPITD